MEHEFTDSQKQALAIATVVALAFGAYFLRSYFIVIVVAAVAAYLFDPLFEWFQKRLGRGLSVALTVLSALAAVIVPMSLLVLLAVAQVSAMVRSISGWVARTDLSSVGDRALVLLNQLIARVPLLHGVHVTEQGLRDRLSTIAQKGGEYLLHFLQGAAGSVIGSVVAAVLFLYVFISLLNNRKGMQVLIRQLNPLGEEVTDLYLARMGAMVRGTVRGHFVIALAQGLTGAVSIYLAGFHEGFFAFAILLTALSVIPLGGGIVSIPFAIGMIFFGNVFGGLFVIAVHVVVVSNIDNVLRPILVPREARLNSALMLLAVFSGIRMFGFWGIVIGPVLMIVIVTTISVYLAVYKGVPLDDPTATEPSPPGRLRELLARARKRSADTGPAKPPSNAP